MQVSLFSSRSRRVACYGKGVSRCSMFALNSDDYEDLKNVVCLTTQLEP